MRAHSYRPAALGIALAVILFAGVALAVEPYDIELYKISVKNLKTGGTTYSEGQTIQINCDWSITKAAESSNWPPMSWNRYIKVDGKTIFNSTVEVPSFFGPKMSKGFGWTWDAQGGGAHTITCGLDNPKHTDLQPKNNEKSTVVQVAALLKARTPGGNVSPSPMGSILPKPNLSIVGSQANIEPYCQKPKPALTAIVTIKNSGGPLGASQGTIFVKEFGGANLSSAGIPLPAIGAGQTQIVQIPAITLQPYGTLAGNHALKVILNPTTVNGQPSFAKPADPGSLMAVFPAGHCVAQGGAAPPGSGQSRGQATPNPTQPRLNLPRK